MQKELWKIKDTLTSNSYLLFLGAGEWQAYGIQCAKNLGIKTIAMDANPNAIGFNITDIAINIDFYNNEDFCFIQIRYK